MRVLLDTHTFAQVEGLPILTGDTQIARYRVKTIW